MSRSLRIFIAQHHAEIDLIIRHRCNNLRHLTDTDRADWIANDESLYQWAKSEGVRV